MLKAKLKGRKYPRRSGWREDVNLYKCETCGSDTVDRVPSKEGTKLVPRGHCDHVIPERAVRQFSKGFDPHSKENLCGLCPRCHGSKLQVERRIYVGDLLSFMQGMLIIGFTKERVNRALLATGFAEVP